MTYLANQWDGRLGARGRSEKRENRRPIAKDLTDRSAGFVPFCHGLLDLFPRLGRNVSLGVMRIVLPVPRAKR